MKDIYIIVPTLNPNLELLESFLDNLKKEFKNILLFDDGCREEYQEFFDKWEKKGIDVLHHYINLGKGRAMKDAFNYLLVKEPKLKGVVTADSDGQHSIEDIKKCAELILEHPNDLILGCRNFDDPKVPKRNKFGNKTTRAVFKTFVGLNITDTQTGLRGLSKEVMIKFLDSKGDRFEYETNQLIDSKTKMVKIFEFPIETIYLENSNSESHFNPITDSIAIYRTFLKYIVSSGSSFLIDILLFALFNKILGSEHILLETIMARCVSSVYNYFVNAKIVFNKNNEAAFYKYALLVVVQVFASGLITSFLNNYIKIGTVLLKVIVDLVIFIVNFIIQREFIFVGDKDEKQN